MLGVTNKEPIEGTVSNNKERERERERGNSKKKRDEAPSKVQNNKDL